MEPMSETEFDERFEGLINDLEYKQSKDIETMPTYREMYRLLEMHIRAHDGAEYQNKNLRDGSD